MNYVLSFIQILTMHHAEIGEIIKVLEEIHFLSDDPDPVKIQFYDYPYDQEDCFSGGSGLRLTTKLIHSFLTVDIADPAKDSNRLRLAFRNDKHFRIRSFYYDAKRFDIGPIRALIRELALIDKRDRTSISSLDASQYGFSLDPANFN
jgi:hypothetical protein